MNVIKSKPLAVTKTDYIDLGSPDDGPDHIITFRCGQETVKYSFGVLIGEKAPTSTLKRGKALFISQEDVK
jgi:hypothetical protein